MAPKPSSALKAVKAKSHRAAAAAPAAAAGGGGGRDEERSDLPPANQAQVLSRVSLEGLPPQSADVEEAVVQLLNIKYETLAQVFAYYCKMSECDTVKTATRLKLGTQNSYPAHVRFYVSGSQKDPAAVLCVTTSNAVCTRFAGSRVQEAS